MENLDVYFKKNIEYQYRGNNLKFKVSQVLFASQQIDHGTQRLLRTLISEKVDIYKKVLDLGCGYGPIGIALKSFQPSSIIHMVDRDALAIEYSRLNAKLNNLNDIKVYGSLGYDDIRDTDFDLIVSNIPAKVGGKALSYILQDARLFLRPGGHVAVVVIDAIAEYVERVLTTDLTINILLRKAWSGHVVFHYEFKNNIPSIPKPTDTAFNRGIFDREMKVFSHKTLSFPMQTTYGLSEFDTLNYETELLLDSLRTLQNRSFDKAVVFHLGQGYIPVVLSLYTSIEKLILIDRDLQAIRISKKNLILNNFPEKNISLLHQVGISSIESKQADCIIGILAEKDGPSVHAIFIKQITSQLTSKGIVIISSNSTAITRVENFIRSEKRLEVLQRKRSKGKSTLILKQRK